MKEKLKNIIKKVALGINIVFVLSLILSAYSGYINPVSFPKLACTDFLFVPLLVANIIFIVAWLWGKNYYYATVSLVAIGITIPSIRKVFPMHLDADVNGEELKVMTYNVMAFNGNYKHRGKNEILEYISKSGADIVCLQEYYVSSNSKYVTQRDVDKALRQYKYRKILPVGSASSNKLAVFSKFPILETRQIPYDSRGNGSHIIKINWRGDDVYVVNNHLESNKLLKNDRDAIGYIANGEGTKERSFYLRTLMRKISNAAKIRAIQAEKIKKEVANLKGENIILCGDFNDIPLSYAYQTISSNLKDAYVERGMGLGNTYNRTGLYFRIDYILYSEKFIARSAWVDKSITSSDHYPVFAILLRQKEVRK